MNFTSLPLLMKRLKDFEFLSRTVVEVVLKTTGGVVLRISDAEDGKSRSTKKFGTVLQATEWVTSHVVDENDSRRAV